MHAVLSEITKNKKGSSHSNKPGEIESAHARERECERSRQCGTDVMSVRQQQLDLTCSRFATTEQQLGAYCADDVRARMPDSFVALKEQSSGMLRRDPHASVCESRGSEHHTLGYWTTCAGRVSLPPSHF